MARCCPVVHEGRIQLTVVSDAETQEPTESSHKTDLVDLQVDKSFRRRISSKA
jgi:hypothetical protein